MTNVDQGTEFGTWSDPVSRFMYHDCMKEFLDGVDIKGTVADYGGANGLLKAWIPNAITIDLDQSKKPDVIDNVLTHEGVYDFVVMRYLLHYLNTMQRKQLLNQLKKVTRHALIIQFVNNGPDMSIKMKNSINEKKFFMTTGDLFDLVWSSGWLIKTVKHKVYKVTREFYKNRLNNTSATPHHETVYALEIYR